MYVHIYIYMFIRRVGIIVHYIGVGIILLLLYSLKKKKHLGSGNTQRRGDRNVFHTFIYLYTRIATR